MSEKIFTVGIVGVRGYVGRELISLLVNQPKLQVDWVSSRQMQGITLSELLNEDANFRTESLASNHYYNDLVIENLSAEAVAERQTDVVVLALPNGLAKSYVNQLELNKLCDVIIDLSADYRFDKDWIYSVPEIKANKNIHSITDNASDSICKISNPGCYATAMQIAIAPLLGQIKNQAHCFGISGFSGAGTTPSANNDPENLNDNILPYGLIEHIHEKEVSYQLQQAISFSPHVASFFRGINMTVQIELLEPSIDTAIIELYHQYFKNEKFIKVQAGIPNVQQVNHSPYCYVGGFKLSADGKRLTIVSSLDNLLKGAASQALQNIALACELDIKILGE